MYALYALESEKSINVKCDEKHYTPVIHRCYQYGDDYSE